MNRIRSFVIALAVGAAAAGLGGCAVALVGAGAAGGYAIGRDSITNHFDVSQSHAFEVSRQVVREMGWITEEDVAHGRIKGSVQEATVTILVTPVSERTVKLEVKSRKLLMPRLAIAQSVYNEIFSRLE